MVLCGIAASPALLRCDVQAADTGEGVAAASRDSAGDAGERPLRTMARDSLLARIKQRTEMIRSLRESLAVATERSGEFGIRSPEAINRALEQFSGHIDDLQNSLTGRDFQVNDDGIAIRNQDGGWLNLELPENLGERISRGIVEISRSLLDELPDTLQLEGMADKFEWSAPQLGRQREQRRVISGDAIKFWDNVFVDEDERVAGHVVSIFGSSTVSGAVDGNVIVVFGDMEIDDTAEISGKAVAVLGRLDRSPDAEIGSVLVIDPFGFEGLGFFDDWRTSGPLTVAIHAAGFVVDCLLLAFLLALLPASRLTNAERTLLSRPAGSFGTGLGAVLLGPIALLVVCSVLIITVLGIPVALLLILAVLLLAILAVAIVSIPLGRRLCQLMSLSCERPLTLALIGFTVLYLPVGLGVLLSVLPALSTLGTVLKLCGVGVLAVAGMFGLGAILISRLGTRAVDETAPAPVNTGYSPTA